MPLFSRPILIAASLAAFSSAHAKDTSAGKASYEINCIACHQIDAHTVGPSLIRIAAVYPEGKEAEFLKWTKTPGKKDPLAVDMPSMAHLPDETLLEIHDFILEVVVGKREKKGKPFFTKYQEPKRELPYVVNAFMPDTSPASVGIILPKNLSLCWDTEACRLRYAWKGNQSAIRGGKKGPELRAEPFYRETSEHLFSGISESKPRYRGYRLIDGYPEFEYQIGNLKFRELVRNGAKPMSFERSFSISGATSDLVLDLSHEGNATFTADKGRISDNKLTLSAAEAANFTLTVSTK